MLANIPRNPDVTYRMTGFSFVSCFVSCFDDTGYLNLLLAANKKKLVGILAEILAEKYLEG